jgi:hypothetical protein
VLLATGVMTLPVLWGAGLGTWSSSGVAEAGLLAVLVVGGGLLYLGFGWVLGLEEARLLTRAVRRRVGFG